MMRYKAQINLRLIYSLEYKKNKKFHSRRKLCVLKLYFHKSDLFKSFSLQVQGTHDIK